MIGNKALFAIVVVGCLWLKYSLWICY